MCSNIIMTFLRNTRSDLSEEDCRFMKTASDSVSLEDGHYYLPLPFCKGEVAVLNNRQMAEQRAQHLLKKFKRDENFLTEYKDFMNDMINKGHAESSFYKRKEKSSWCHGVYHKLTKWVSNSRAVLASIPKEDKVNQMTELDLDREKLPNERALGIQWNIENDTFTFQINMKSQPFTRRGPLVSMVSSVYDPLGFLSLFVLEAKLILQELCRMKFGWDEDIPEHLAKIWQKLLSDLNQLSTFQVARSMKPDNFSKINTA